MEKWKEVYKGQIPEGNYQTKIEISEENGILVFLNNNNYKVKIDFGALSAMRILDEGVVLQELYSKLEFSKYEQDCFTNTIYKIEEGNFENFIKEINGEQIYNYLEYNHFLVITYNYFIEVITQWEPTIEVI